MNVVRIAGVDFAAHASLFECVSLALDISESRQSEIEVFRDGVKLAGFERGHRVFPPKQEGPMLVNYETHAIEQALDECGGSIPRAAKLLKMGRTTLYRKLKDAKPPEAMRRAA